MVRTLLAVFLVGLLIVGALGVYYLHKKGRLVLREARKDAPNIVVIVMDTARQDRLSCYGYSRETSPHLQALMQSSTRYDNAHSTSSWTAPAHASLFTGLFPIAHGTTQENWTMSPDLVTIAEVLRKHGYETVSIVENPMLAGYHGYRQGFAAYHQMWSIEEEPRSGNHALDRFIEELDDRERRKRLWVLNSPEPRPFFVFVNLIEPHSPYNSSGQFYGTFLSDPSIPLEENKWREYYLGEYVHTPEEMNHLNELYDAEMLYTDWLVGNMAEELRERGLWENTVFIVTSDHGENIGDHGHVDHMFSLYETTTKIPLMIHCPRFFPPGTSDSRPVQITDVFPTVLSLAGANPDKYPCHGRNLLSDAFSNEPLVFCEYYLPEQVLHAYRDPEARESPRLDPYRRRLKSVTAGPVKFIWGSDGNHELYDLSADPTEAHNLIEDEAYADTRHLMDGLLQDLVDRYGEGAVDVSGEPAPVVDEETEKALRSLGYVE